MTDSVDGALQIVTISKLSLNQLYKLIKTYFENEFLIREMNRSLRAIYNPHNRSSEQASRRIIKMLHHIATCWMISQIYDLQKLLQL